MNISKKINSKRLLLSIYTISIVGLAVKAEETALKSNRKELKSLEISSESVTPILNIANEERNQITNNQDLSQKADFYYKKHQLIDRYLSNAANRTWDHKFMDYLDQLDIQNLESTMLADKEVCGMFLMLYPKKIPTSGMGTITQNNLNEFTFANKAAPNIEPPSDANGKKILTFYKTYCWFKYELNKNKTRLSDNLRRAIQKVGGAHNRQKYKNAKLAKRYGELASELLKGDMRIDDLKNEAIKTYQTTVSGFGSMLSGNFHKTHLEDIVVFKNRPSFKSETDADLITTVIPGETAYLTGYFTMTNKDAGGIPSLLFINPENKYAKDVFPWGHGAEIIAPMFNGENIKTEFREKAYFSFNLFPDISTVNYKSHVQYFPHLNFIKWLRYLPSEVIDLHVRYGLNESVATGKIRIDLSGDNKKKLEEYALKLEAKRLASVTFPDFSGCNNTKSTISNKSDLNQYGEVLKVSLMKKGDIMKPFPHDSEIDFNTAYGYAAVKKVSGKIEIMPLQFRKKPTETAWKFWSVGTWPNLYSIKEQMSSINAVQKLEHGYEILPENIEKCTTWYEGRR
jgi:hypothetical protein